MNNTPQEKPRDYEQHDEQGGIYHDTIAMIPQEFVEKYNIQ